MRPRLLDLFCCAGGAARGYDLAGFDVYGVDQDPQPRYPFHFIQGDVLRALHELRGQISATFCAIHASPPCQGYTELTAPGQIGAPQLIEPVRVALQAIGLPYVIENVAGAAWAMQDPITLCGTMFGLGAHGCELQRHRLFESNVPIAPPSPCDHTGGPVVGVYGDHARVRAASHGGRGTRDPWPETHREVMNRALGTGWMTAREASEAIPPAYTQHIGGQLMAALRSAA